MRIFTVSPLPLGHTSWDRDITLLYRGLCDHGIASCCVRMHSNDGSVFPGVIQASRENMCSPEWWAEHSLDGVVINTWGNPKYTPMVQAIKCAGVRVLVRLDTNGISSPLVSPRLYAKYTYSNFRNRSMCAGKALVATGLKCLLYTIPQVYDLKSIAHLDLADFISVESEEAYQRTTILMRRHGFGRLSERLHIIRHPAAPDVLGLDVKDLPSKQKAVVAVGRWNAYQKNTPLMISVLSKALEYKADYEAHLIGAGRELIEKCLAKAPPSVRGRIHVYGPVPHDQVVEQFQKCRVCLSMSRWESGPIVASEALCCGCTFFAQDNGAVPLERIRKLSAGGGIESKSPQVLAEGLVAEMRRWDRGEYDSQRIATEARVVYSYQQVARKILTLFSGILGGRQTLDAGIGTVERGALSPPK